ncbi:lim2 protein [Pelomyxa schiedti]|nr:lim2 protein [Pelomyxa schiedti]
MAGAPSIGELDSLMADLGISTETPGLSASTSTSTTSTTSAGPGAKAVSCSGPGRGAAMSGPGRGAMSGPGRGAMSGPGRGAMCGPGVTPAAAPAPMTGTPTNIAHTEADELLNEIGVEPDQSGPIERVAADGTRVIFEGPTCVSCGKFIMGPIFSANDKDYHPECFKCADCATIIEDEEPFVEHTDGHIYCQQCYQNRYGPKCFSCSRPLTTQCVKFADRMYHPEHFNCTDCGCKLFGQKYMDHEGDPYCVPCKNLRMAAVKPTGGSGEICGRCKRPIIGAYLVINGQKMHPEHFRCEECGADFMGGNCRELEGRHYCEECFLKRMKSTCSKCGKPILGRSTTAVSRMFHPECFTCTVCNIILGTDFREKDGSPYCEIDYNKLFAKVCHKCQKAVANEGFEFSGKFFHPACFVCSGCGENLYRKKLFDNEGKATCQNCFKTLPKEVQKKLVDKQRVMEKAAKAKREEEQKAAKAKAKADKAAAKAAAKRS